MRRSLTLLATIVICLPALAGAQVSMGTVISRIEHDIRPVPVMRGTPPTSIDARMRVLRVPAVSIAVVDSGRIVWAKAYGVADVSTGKPATDATRFQTGSISKPVAAMAALRLVDEGKLSLDADVNIQLWSWKIPANALSSATPVTLRMLLSHTAGLTVHGFPGHVAGTPMPTVPQILDGIAPANTAPVRVDLAPGTRWRYSGGGMTVAQLLMTDVTNEPFPALVRRLVLDPAKMASSGYEQPLPEAVVPFAASGHRADFTVIPGGWNAYPEMMAAGLWSTPSDLGRFIIELQHAYAGTSTVLTQAAAHAMLTRGLGGWGLGIQVVGIGDSMRFMHGGVNEGFQGTFVGYVRGGRGVVVLTNSDAGMQLADEIVAAVGREYNWPGLRELTEHAEIAVDSAVLARYVGRYQLAPNAFIAITQSGSQLSAQATGQAAFPIFPEGQAVFFAKVTELEIRFESDANGKVTAISILQHGNTSRAVRIE